MDNKPILKIHVEVNRKDVRELQGPDGVVKMLPFGGAVEGKIFHGIVSPGAVDTQVTNCNQVRHMSARYMLEGYDEDENFCHIYIENNGWFTNGERPSPFMTVPSFLTDSPTLARYLNRDNFRGEGRKEDGKLTIYIFERY